MAGFGTGQVIWNGKTYANEAAAQAAMEAAKAPTTHLQQLSVPGSVTKGQAPATQYSSVPLTPGPAGIEGGYATAPSVTGLQRATEPAAPSSSMTPGIATQNALDAQKGINTLGQENTKASLDLLKSEGLLPTSAGGSAPVAFDTQGLHTAQDLAFARAKDRVGQNARASVTALQNELAARGVGSAPGAQSGIETNALAGVVGSSGSDLANVISDQAQQEAAQGYDLAKTQYGGNITQRGQTLSTLPSLLGLVRAGNY